MEDAQRFRDVSESGLPWFPVREDKSIPTACSKEDGPGGTDKAAEFGKLGMKPGGVVVLLLSRGNDNECLCPWMPAAVEVAAAPPVPVPPFGLF